MIMSQQYDVKCAILDLMANPDDKDIAVQLLLHAVEQGEEDFELDNDCTPYEYLFDN